MNKLQKAAPRNHFFSSHLFKVLFKFRWQIRVYEQCFVTASVHLHKDDIFTSQQLTRFCSYALSVSIYFPFRSYFFFSFFSPAAEEEPRNPGQVSTSGLSNEYIYKIHASANAFRENRTQAQHRAQTPSSGTRA